MISEHATEFLGMRKLNESEFQGTSLGNKEETAIFCWEKGNMPLPPNPRRP